MERTRALLPGFVLALAVLGCGPAPAAPGPDALYADDTGFFPLGAPKAGSWRASFEEPDQTFGDYVASDPTRVTPGRDRRAFVLEGPFSERRREIAEETVAFAGLWFDLPVALLSDRELPARGFQRERDFSWVDHPVTQYRADWFLRELLPPILPEDAAVLAAVTDQDLYPEDSWNYVFGMATFEERVAVYSIARFFDSFWGRPPDGDTRRRALLRSLKLVTHELGHAFGLRHCTFYECGMNGSLSLEESDRQPIHLCPVCLRKLAGNRGFDPVRRYERLRERYEEWGLVEQAEWVGRRLARIRR